MNRSGQYVKNLSGKMQYYSFKPAALPSGTDLSIGSNLLNRIKEAYRLIGKLDGVSDALPDRKLFISMYVRKEALLSSQIEGTQATLDDIFDPFIGENMDADLEEVINYLKTLNRIDSLLVELPISIRFIKELHKNLMDGTRGEEKNPGQLRRSQNWIGPAGKSIRDARFVPPNVDDMKLSLSELEKFIHNEDTLDSLIKIALIHYQFETIHPFLDGNGRIGRLLINVLLKHYGLMQHDTLYLSYYLKRNRTEYYEKLMDVREKGLYEAWIAFFIEGIIESANHALNSIHSIFELRKNVYSKINKAVSGKAQNTMIALMEHLESHPIMTIKSASQATGKSFNAISNAVRTLEDMDVLRQVKGKKRYRVYGFEDYLEILRDGTDLPM